MQKLKKIFINIILLAILSNCSVIAIGTVAAVAGTTAVIATDPRKSSTLWDDNTIAKKISDKISNDYNSSNIYVTCYNKAVLLTGQAQTEKVKNETEFFAKTIPGVKEVYNFEEVRLPQSFASRTNDSFITTQIKTKLVGMSNINSNNVKVVTTNNIVYLLGIVNKQQATEIASAASHVSDVNKVITLFEYK